jgi:hypothetical protein
MSSTLGLNLSELDPQAALEELRGVERECVERGKDPVALWAEGRNDWVRLAPAERTTEACRYYERVCILGDLAFPDRGYMPQEDTSPTLFDVS